MIGAVVIQEGPNSWDVIGGGETLATRATALGALAFVKTRDADLAMAAGRNVVTVVSWQPTTDAGARIVRAVAGLR